MQRVPTALLSKSASYFSAMAGFQGLRFSNAKDDALEFVLAQGRNTVLWDECTVIWDSQSLVEDVPHSASGSLAIFGVKGKLSTPQNARRNFRVRNYFDSGAGGGYFIQATVDGELHEPEHSVKIFVDQGKQMFEESVKSLTEGFSSKGLEETMKNFMTPSKPLQVTNGTSTTNGLTGCTRETFEICQPCSGVCHRYTLDIYLRYTFVGYSSDSCWE